MSIFGKGGGLYTSSFLGGEQIENRAVGTDWNKLEHLRRDGRPNLTGRISAVGGSSGNSPSSHNEPIRTGRTTVFLAGGRLAYTGVRVTQKAAGDIDASDKDGVPLQSPPPGSLPPGGETTHPFGAKTFIIPYLFSDLA